MTKRGEGSRRLGGDMKRIVQEDENGCGMACVAMIAGIDYNNACNLFKTKSGRGCPSSKHLGQQWA